jgi:alkylation response protein AidB-like acyl-CoA dehydrogenase
MSVRTYAVESLLYRTAGMIDETIGRDNAAAAVLAAMEEFAVEASIAKVAGSEVLDFVLDENVQIHGGNGFVKDYPAERHYRDARVNRIFEGTNEINRLLIPGMLIRRALKGDLPLLPAARQLQDEILGAAGLAETPVEGFKKVALMTLGLALQRYGDDLPEQQEVLIALADVIIAIACAESAALRAAAAPENVAAWHHDAAAVCVNTAAIQIDTSARQVLATISEGDSLRMNLAGLRRLLKLSPVDTVTRRRRIADETISRKGYIFQ